MKNILLYRIVNQVHDVPSPRRHEGTKRDRHGTFARDAMDAAASGGLCSLDENAAAYGEVVWSWRRDPGVYPCRPVLAGQR